RPPGLPGRRRAVAGPDRARDRPAPVPPRQWLAGAGADLPLRLFAQRRRPPQRSTDPARRSAGDLQRTGTAVAGALVAAARRERTFIGAPHRGLRRSYGMRYSTASAPFASQARMGGVETQRRGPRFAQQV